MRFLAGAQRSVLAELGAADRRALEATALGALLADPEPRVRVAAVAAVAARWPAGPRPTPPPDRSTRPPKHTRTARPSPAASGPVT